MIKLYSDQRYLYSGMLPDSIFHPFWSASSADQQVSWSKRYEQYLIQSKSLFEMVPLEAADFAVMPTNWRTIRGDAWNRKVNHSAQKLSLEFAQKAEQAKKPLIVFFSGDCSDEKIPIEDCIVFRQGPYRSKQTKNDFCLPAFTEDLIKYYCGDRFFARQKGERPVVGFCGLVKQNSWKMVLKKSAYHALTLLKERKLKPSPYMGETLRDRGLKILAKSPLVETNFIIRDQSVFLGENSTERKQQVRSEFVQNMMQSDYIFNCRGSGNFSCRLFETLCCGRIPIFIDTDCVLPFDFKIDWKKYCVWVEEKEVAQIADKVAEFHDHLSPQGFMDLQYECRQLWKEWLSAEGFYTNFYRHFQVQN